MMQSHQSQFNQNQKYLVLEASIDASVLIQIFSNLTKELKQNQCFYLCIRKNQIKIGVEELSQNIEIELTLKFNAFSYYTYTQSNEQMDNEDQYKVYKYSLNNFQYFDTFFESCKSQLKLKVFSTQIQFSYQTNNKNKTKFNPKGKTINQGQLNNLQQSGFLTKSNQIKDEEYVKVKIPKIRYLQQVIHTSCTFKEEYIGISYKSDNKIVFQVNKQVKKTLKVEQIEDTFQTKRFLKSKYYVRKMKLATSLLQGQKQANLCIHNNYLKLQYQDQKQKKYDIKVLRIAQYMDEEF